MSDLPLELAELEKPQREALVLFIREEIRTHVEEKADAIEKNEPWDHTYKGDSYWIEFRRQALRLLEQERAVHWSDVRADPWFQKESHLVHGANQWDRARKKLVRGLLREASDDSELMEFFVRGRGGRKWYLSHLDEMHCAAEVATEKEHIAPLRAPQIVRRLRERWGATEMDTCAGCQRDLRKMAL